MLVSCVAKEKQMTTNRSILHAWSCQLLSTQNYPFFDYNF